MTMRGKGQERRHGSWLDEEENTEKKLRNDILEEPLHSCLRMKTLESTLEKS